MPADDLLKSVQTLSVEEIERLLRARHADDQALRIICGPPAPVNGLNAAKTREVSSAK